MVPQIRFYNPTTKSMTTFKVSGEVSTDVMLTLQKGNKGKDLLGFDDAILTSNNLHEAISEISFNLPLGYPNILKPKYDELVTSDVVFEITPYLHGDTYSGDVDSAEWEIATDEEFKHIVKTLSFTKQTAYNNNICLYKPEVDMRSGFYYVRARYKSGNLYSPWSKSVRFNFPSWNMQTPTIEATDADLYPVFTTSEFTMLNDTVDTQKATVWGIKKVEKDITGFVNNSKVTEFMTNPVYDYTITLTVNPNTLNSKNIDFGFEPESAYIVTAVHQGENYISTPGHTVFYTDKYQITKPTVTVVENGVTPGIKISRFGVNKGYDSLDHYQVDIVDLGNMKSVLTAMLDGDKLLSIDTGYIYNVPKDVLKPNTAYSISVKAYGTRYLPSETTAVIYTVPNIGIATPNISVRDNEGGKVVSISPYSTINCNDRLAYSEWELYTNDNKFEGVEDELIPVTSLITTFKLTADKNPTTLALGKEHIVPNTHYIVKVRYVGDVYKSEWTEIRFKSIDLNIVRPTITTAIRGINILVDISDYTINGDDDRPDYVIYKVEYKDGSQPSKTFNVPYSTKHTVLTKDHGIQPGVTYNISGRIIGVKYATDWSPVSTIAVPALLINPPKIYIEKPEAVQEHPTFKTDALTLNIPGIEEVHQSTEWTISEKRIVDGETKYVNIHSSTSEHNLTSYLLEDKVLKVSSMYSLTVRFQGAKLGWSEPTTVYFTTADTFVIVPEADGVTEIPDVAIPPVTTDDEKNNKVLGVVDYNTLISNRLYMGEWANNVNYYKGNQVLYNDQLYYAVDDILGFESPGQNKKWVLDTRENLPTMKWLLKQLGYFGAYENQEKTLEEGQLPIKIADDELDVNIVKTIINDKVLYVYTGKTLSNVAYNDLVRSGITTGKYTLRIGSRLYYVRLLYRYEAEYLNKVIELNPGNETINKLKQGVSDKYYVIDKSLVGSLRAAIEGEDNIVNETSARVRDSYLRLVLEYIPAEVEPWKIMKQKFPNLVYDMYTDTGYFGEIKHFKPNLIYTFGITKGQVINADFGYLGFYSHGSRLLVNKADYIYNISYQYLLDKNLVFGQDYVYEKRSDLSEEMSVELADGDVPNNVISDGNVGKQYTVRLLRGGNIGYRFEDGMARTDISASDNICYHSEWNELLYRVSMFNPQQFDVGNLHGGFQIGSNWANMKNSEIGVFEHYSGNGCHSMVASPVNDDSYLTRGGTRLETLAWFNIGLARNDIGVRFVLEDNTDYRI